MWDVGRGRRGETGVGRREIVVLCLFFAVRAARCPGPDLKSLICDSDALSVSDPENHIDALACTPHLAILSHQASRTKASN